MLIETIMARSVRCRSRGCGLLGEAGGVSKRARTTGTGGRHCTLTCGVRREGAGGIGRVARGGGGGGVRRVLLVNGEGVERGGGWIWSSATCCSRQVVSWSCRGPVVH